MLVSEVRARAKALEISGIGKMRKADIILKIQQAENNTPCFGSEQRKDCPYDDCCWRGDCVRV